MNLLNGAAAIFAVASVGCLAGVVLRGPAYAAGETHVVAMTNIAFSPRSLHVHVGDTVEWADQDIVAHTASARDRTFDVNVLPGRRGRALMKRAGTFAYFCRYHPTMTGELVVEP